MGKATVYESRVKRLLRSMRRERLDGFLVWDRADTRYLSGFEGSASVILITPERGYFLTDFRYVTVAKSEIGHLRVIQTGQEQWEDLARLVRRHRLRRVGFEGKVPFSLYERWSKKLGVELVEAAKLVSDLRVRKCRAEISRIAQAQRIAEKALDIVLEHCRPGVSEKELARLVVRVMEDEGADGPSFDPIIAAGPNSALPHAHPSDRKLRRGDFVTFDIGAFKDGYASDMTRTFVLGRATDRQREIYRIVLEAQKRAIATVRAGAAAREVDRAARSFIEKKGFAKNFGHGIGHGVGLEIHEPPSLSAKSDDVLHAGMVVTVEPGIYRPGWGGVRIEDMILVKDEGGENLTRYPKKLIELPVD